jgi:hypothetical protein
MGVKAMKGCGFADWEELLLRVKAKYSDKPPLAIVAAATMSVTIAKVRKRERSSFN